MAQPATTERPTPPTPMMAHGLAGADHGGVDRGADAGHDGAADGRGRVDVNVLVQRHDHLVVDDDVARPGEGADRRPGRRS